LKASLVLLAIGVASVAALRNVPPGPPATEAVILSLVVFYFGSR